MILAKDLRDSVLQKALEGKLTDREDDDTEVNLMLNKNKEVRNNLVERKLIKKEIVYSIEDASDYSIPDRWSLVCFNEVFQVLNGDRGKNYPSKDKLSNTGSIPFISALNLNNTNVTVDDNLLYLSENQYDLLNAGKLKKDDICLCIRGSLGKHGLFQFDKGAIASSLVIIRPISDIVNPKYLFVYLDSPYLQNEIQKYNNGTAQPNLSADNLKRFVFPLPPIEEQVRIVAKVDELMAKIDEYEKIEKELSVLESNISTSMKESILQAAMQGKLTKQLDADKKVVISKILKKPCIIDTEYNVPDNWECRTIGDVIDIINGFTPLRSNQEFWNKNEIPWFTVEDIHLQGRFINSTKQFITKKALSNNTKRLLPKDSILLCCTASVGEYAYTNIEVTTNQQFNGLVIKDDFKNEILPMYLYYFVQTLKNKLIDKSGATTFNFLSTKKLASFQIPIPPIEEQQRIVDKLDKLLPLCESLNIN